MRQKDGFTLVETMIAVAILSFALAGLAALFLNSIKADHTAKLRFMATDVMTSEIEEIRLLGYTNLTRGNMTTAPFNYVNTPRDLPSEYRFPGINVAPEYDWCVFKGVNRERRGKDRVGDYLYTLKLSVDDDYLATPTLKRGKMDIFWMYGGRLKTTNLGFMVERKP